MLLGLSPCKRYAFVQQSDDAPDMPTVYTYHTVDIANGKTWALLRDQYERKTGRRMWQNVFWIPLAEHESQKQ